MALDDGLRDPLAWDELAHGGHAEDVRHPLVVVDRVAGPLQLARYATIGIAGEIELVVNRRAELQTAHVDAALSETAHGHQHHHAARPLLTGSTAPGAAEARTAHTAGQVSLFLRPHPGECAHVLRRNAGFRLLPLRCLRHPVGFAHHIGAPLIEPGGPGADVLGVVQTFLYPDIHDRDRERGVRLGPD